MTETLMQGSGITRKITGTAPMLRADGSVLPLAEIAGYNVYVRSSWSSFDNPAVAASLVGGEFDYAFDVDSVLPAIYTITITAIDTDGRESARSAGIVIEVVAQVISAPNPPVVA